jgi:D-3-phosphoglycerate dehydrogenase
LPPNVELCSLDQLLTESDLISIHAGRDAAAGPLIGPHEFSLIKEGSRLVNTSRGYLVHEEALLQSLHSGRLSSAALDVFENEPYKGPLSEFPQVLCTPHVSTLTTASRAAMELRCAKNVVEFFNSFH